MILHRIHQSFNHISSTNYSFVIVVACCLIMAVSTAARSAFGVFFKPMSNELGWSSAAISSTFSISVLVEGILSFISGRLTDKFGPRIVMILGGLLSGSGFLLMSQVQNIWQMYLVYGVMIGIGLGGVFVPLLTTIARWFVARRAFVTGIILACNGLGWLMSPPIANRLISHFDWRLSYIIFGIALFIFVILPGLFLRREPPATDQILEPKNAKISTHNISTKEYSLKGAILTRQFWMIFIILMCYGFCMISIQVHLVPHIIETGISATIAANILATIGGAMIIGRLAFGILVDNIGSKKAIIIGFIPVSLVLLTVIFAKEVWSLYLFAIIYGFGLGAISSSQSPLTVEFFGIKSHGSIFGIFGFANMLGGAIGSLINGYFFDITGNYQLSFMTLAIIGITGLSFSIALKTFKFKVQHQG